jgi:SAM-dependent methyltransferase
MSSLGFQCNDAANHTHHAHQSPHNHHHHHHQPLDDDDDDEQVRAAAHDASDSTTCNNQLDQRTDRHQLTHASYVAHASTAIENWSLPAFVQMPWLLAHACSLFQSRNLRAPMHALDLGCALGSDARSLARLPSACRVVGLDVVSEFLDQARQLTEHDSTLLGTVQFVQLDLLKLDQLPHILAQQQLEQQQLEQGDSDDGQQPTPSYTAFDIVWSNSVFMHLNDCEFGQVLQHLTHLMRPGSLLAASIASPSPTCQHGLQNECQLSGAGGSALLQGDFIPGRYLRPYAPQDVLHALRTWCPARWTVLYCKLAPPGTEVRSGAMTHLIALLN